MITVSKVEIFPAYFPILRSRKIWAVLMFLTVNCWADTLYTLQKKKHTTQIFQLISFKC